MADEITSRKRMSSSTIVAIIAVCITVVLGIITIWQASYFYSQQQRINEQVIISNKIDNLGIAVQEVKISVAQLSQRLEDHLGGAHKR